MLGSLSFHTRAILPKITTPTNSHSSSSLILTLKLRRLKKSTPQLTSSSSSSSSSSSISYKNNNTIKHVSPCCLFTPRNFRLFSSSMGSLSLSDEPLNYPTFRRDDSVVDTYHGVPVPDPYRWLEDPDAEEVKEFVKKQVDLTESVLKKCETRGKLHEKLTKFYDYPKFGAPFREADKYFYFHNSGLQPQKVLYMQDSLDGQAEVLLDPNGLSDDGTISLNTYAVSEDAKYLAYALSSSGSDWVTVKVMQIEGKKVLPDTLSWVKFSGISWTNDSKGFFYSRYPAPKEGENLDAGTETNANLDHQLYYHYLGTDQSEDILCWKNPDNPQHTLGASVTEDGKFVLLYINEDCDPVNKLYYCDLSTLPSGIKGCKEKKCLPFIKLIDNFEAMYQAIANDDTVFTFLTNKDAPKYKLVRVDLKEPSIWTEVIPQAENDVLDSAVAVNGNQLIVSYMSDCKHILQMRDLQSGSLLHQLPISIGSVDDVSARRKDSLFFIAFTSFLTPGTIYQCNLESGVPDLKIFREIVVSGFDQTEFQVSQVFVPSKDGSTQIPMFVVARKDIVLDRSHPCLLYGYGGFNISLTPYFSVSRVALMRHLGVVFCIANIRGGGEYGEEWHKDGSLAKKQNCFDDFISSAEYLVSSGYTQPKKLAIEGGSNGGLLIGACINQRPDLFGCALAHVGVMDMLRFHKFTIGHAWTSDYGCSDKEEDFQWLIKYSPLHNVRRPWEQSTDNSCQYPPTLLLTADHDDRVVPLHTLKLLATMQYVLCTSLENSPQTNPILGRIDVKAGHGAGRPTKKVIDEWADSYSFMAKVVGATWID